MLLLLFVLGAACVSAFCPLNAVNSSSRNNCFTYYGYRLPFDQAEVFCQNMGGHLASISNAFEGNQIVMQARNSAEGGNFWIGLKKNVYGTFQWTDSTPVNYQHWASDAKNSTLQCGAVRVYSSEWVPNDCLQALPFACILTPAVQFPCDSGWTWNKDTRSCYKVIHDFDSFDGAEGLCVQSGGHLASIHSQAENAFVISLARANYKFGVTEHDLQCWTGLKRRCSSCSDFVWTDGTPLDFNAWASDRPKSDKNYDCVEVFTDPATALDSSKINKWNNEKCGNTERVAVCKRPQYV